MGATFDGRVWTRYAHRTQIIGEWRELTKFYSCRTQSEKSCGRPRSTNRLSHDITIPAAFARNIPGHNRGCKYNTGRFTLECYLGRTLESFEVCRHGIAGPNDHSYLNVSPGDSVNNMIDDLENGKSETTLTYLIQAQQRLARLISQQQFQSPTK